MGAFITLRDVVKTYNAGRADEMRALKGVSLTIARGSITVLAGPSGSGKTTLLSLLGCMSRPTSGTVTVGERNVSKLPERFLTRERRRTFGFIFQSLNLLGDLSVFDNIALPLFPLPTGFADVRERVRKAAGEVRLSERLSTPAGRLSGGEQQRVAIARALVNDPEVIIADEPTAHLDSQLTGELLQMLTDLNGRGRTIVISTHDPSVHSRPEITDRVFMRDGLLEESTS